MLLIAIRFKADGFTLDRVQGKWGRPVADVENFVFSWHGS